MLNAKSIMLLWIMMVPFLGICAGDEDWPVELVHHNSIEYSADSWVRAAWNNSHVQVLYQIHPRMFVCGFAIQFKSVARVMDLLVRQNRGGDVYIKQTNSFIFGAETPSKQCVVIKKTDTLCGKKSLVDLDVLDGPKVVNHEQKLYSTLPPLAFKVCGHTLYVTAGEDFKLPIVPKAPPRGRMYWSPSLYSLLLGPCYDIQNDRSSARFPKKTSICQLYKYEKMAHALSGLLFVSTDFLRTSRDPSVPGCESVVERRTVNKPDVSLEECFLLKLDCGGSVVTVRPFPCVLRPGGGHLLWGVSWFIAGHMGARLCKSLDVLCDLVCENGFACIFLYSYFGAHRRDICHFSFPEAELKPNAMSVLSYRDNFPCLSYSISTSLELALCCGKAVDEGPFYICNLRDEVTTRTAFMGGDPEGEVWKKIGFPQLSFLFPDQCNIAPAPIDVSGQNTPICAFAFRGNPLNMLMFYYKVESIGDGYCMNIRTQAQFWSRRDRELDISIQLTAHDVSTHKVSVESAQGAFVVHLSSKACLTLQCDFAHRLLKTWLNIEAFIQDIGSFVFGDVSILQQPPSTLPLPCDYSGEVRSSTLLRFDDRQWGLVAKNIFATNECRWERSIQLLYTGSQRSFYWLMRNLQDGSEVVCSTKLANDGEDEGILMYYMYYTTKPNMRQNCCVWACGAVLMDAQTGRFTVKKARVDQGSSIPTLSDLRAEDVRDWDATDIKIVPESSDIATFNELTLEQRLQFCFGQHCVYFSPISSSGDSLAFNTLFAEFHLHNEESHQVVLDAIKI